MEDSEPIAPAYILENSVFHARHVPTASKHAFTYPTIALLLSLSSLETHKLDLGHGRFFGFGDAGFNSFSSSARIAGIRPETYLHDPNSYRSMKRKSIREKLEGVLKRYGHDANELEDAWMLTMPSYLGIEGINPLTMFYCYKKADTKLWIVVLEVHNTFGERHVYVLPIGLQHEDKNIPADFTHSWTFPRQFHVSPFNDRSGYYRCFLIPPSYPPASALALLTSPSELSHTPPSLPKILIQLWTPDGQLKLTASLRATSAVSLTSRNLLTAFVKYPFTLLLTFPRIALQAFHLHYLRGLNVYARPESRAVEPELETRLVGSVEKQEGKDVLKELLPRNEVQIEGGQFGVGGSIGWQPEGFLERFARKRIERFLEYRAQETGIQVHLLSTNPAFEPKEFPIAPGNAHWEPGLADVEKKLTLLTRSPRAFLLVLASPTPWHALLLSQDAERLLVVSDERLFFEVFSTPLKHGDKSLRYTIMQRMSQWLRRFPIPDILRQESHGITGRVIPVLHPLDIPYPPLSQQPANYDLQFAFFGMTTFLVLSTFLTLAHLEKIIFVLFRARFVKDTEPWGMWDRAEKIWLARIRLGQNAVNFQRTES